MPDETARIEVYRKVKPRAAKWTGVLSRSNGDATETHRGIPQRECASDDKCHLVGDPVRLIVATRKS